MDKVDVVCFVLPLCTALLLYFLAGLVFVKWNRKRHYSKGGLEGATSLMMEWEVVWFIMLLLIKVGTLFLAAAGLYFIVVMVDWTY